MMNLAVIVLKSKMSFSKFLDPIRDNGFPDKKAHNRVQYYN